MDPARALLVFGTMLLAIAALLGFVQERHRREPETFAQWRVVHAGGTAGAVQLLVLSTIWQRFPGSVWAAPLAWGLIFATWAFFLGPLAKALGHPRLARIVNTAGALAALPSFLALPIILLA